MKVFTESTCLECYSKHAKSPAILKWLTHELVPKQEPANCSPCLLVLPYEVSECPPCSSSTQQWLPHGEGWRHLKRWMHYPKGKVPWEQARKQRLWGDIARERERKARHRSKAWDVCEESSNERVWTEDTEETEWERMTRKLPHANETFLNCYSWKFSTDEEKGEVNIGKVLNERYRVIDTDE